MKSGRVFDTKEFAVYDGDGIRVTYFLQGCPLRCEWCHNPEGQPMDGGRILSPKEMIDEIHSYARLWGDLGGGVTFSGGEPLMQEEFLSEVLDGIDGISKIIETCAAVPGRVFQKIVSRMDFVYVDLKLFDGHRHLQYTGMSNQQILENIRWLSKTEIPAVIRIPMIPEVSATQENYRQTAGFLSGLSRIFSVELLPYNTLTKAKYDAVNRDYRIHFDERGDVCEDTEIFTREDIPCRIL